MSLFGAVRLYLIGRAADGRATAAGEAFPEEETPFDPPSGAWRRWWVAGTGASQAARERRRARRGAVPQPLQPKVRTRS